MSIGWLHSKEIGTGENVDASHLSRGSRWWRGRSASSPAVSPRQQKARLSFARFAKKGTSQEAEDLHSAGKQGKETPHSQIFSNIKLRGGGIVSPIVDSGKTYEEQNRKTPTMDKVSGGYAGKVDQLEGELGEELKEIDPGNRDGSLPSSRKPASVSPASSPIVSIGLRRVESAPLGNRTLIETNPEALFHPIPREKSLLCLPPTPPLPELVLSATPPEGPPEVTVATPSITQDAHGTTTIGPGSIAPYPPSPTAVDPSVPDTKYGISSLAVDALPRRDASEVQAFPSASVKMENVQDSDFPQMEVKENSLLEGRARSAVRFLSLRSKKLLRVQLIGEVEPPAKIWQVNLNQDENNGEASKRSPNGLSAAPPGHFLSDVSSDVSSEVGSLGGLGESDMNREMRPVVRSIPAVPKLDGRQNGSSSMPPRSGSKVRAGYNLERRKSLPHSPLEGRGDKEHQLPTNLPVVVGGNDEKLHGYNVASQGQALVVPEASMWRSRKEILSGWDTIAAEPPEAIVAETIQMTGDLEFTRLLRLDGKLDGKLISKGSLIVGSTGYMLGDVRGLRHLCVEGEVLGDVVCESVNIISKGKVTGSITAAVISCGPQATIRGSIHVLCPKSRTMTLADLPPLHATGKGNRGSWRSGCSPEPSQAEGKSDIPSEVAIDPTIDRTDSILFVEGVGKAVGGGMDMDDLGGLQFGDDDDLLLSDFSAGESPDESNYPPLFL